MKLVLTVTIWCDVGLTTAMTVRNLKQLEQAISYVKRNGFEIQLQHELIEAQKVLLQLRRLERIRAEILELKQATVAEIRSYQKPPPVVHIVMTGTFLILGHKEKETKVCYRGGGGGGGGGLLFYHWIIPLGDITLIYHYCCFLINMGWHCCSNLKIQTLLNKITFRT